MLIRYGFKIAFSTSQSTPVLAHLDVHPDRRWDIHQESSLTISGFEAPEPHLDVHGNLCRRLTAHPGDATLELYGVIEVPGVYEAKLTNEPAWSDGFAR